MDKQHAYYVPAVSLCASRPLLGAVADILHELGAIPPRRLSPATNQASATLKITSRSQLDAVCNTLCPYGKNAAYWDALDRHIRQSRQPYYAARSISHAKQ